VQQLARKISIGWADPVLNATLASTDAAPRPFTRHFNQFGDPFLQLEAPYTVPSLPIHHDVRRTVPSAEYLAGMREAVADVVRIAPQLFAGLGWFFDQTEILRPTFYRVHRDGDEAFLYLLRLDLAMRPGEGTVIERGTSDAKARWTSRKLYVDPTLVPLAGPPEPDGERAFAVPQTISDTYLGEVADPGGNYGPYNWQGVWMDPRLTRFFSWLLLPSGADLYPLLPFPCRYGTVCAMPIDLSVGGCGATIPLLRRALGFLVPAMPSIEAALRGTEFSPKLDVFQELKREVPESWYEPWRGVRVEAYLNENDRKEYRLDA
jgi:hypothetical protein